MSLQTTDVSCHVHIICFLADFHIRGGEDDGGVTTRLSVSPFHYQQALFLEQIMPFSFKYFFVLLWLY